MKKFCLFLFLLLMSIVSLTVSNGFCDEFKENYSTKNPGEDYSEMDNLNDLREIHEGTVFLLKRYATLEAITTALEQKKDDNLSYAIGASSLVPGVGQMINQDYLQGGLLMFASGISWGTVQQLAYTKKKRQQYLDLMPLYYGALLVKNGLMTYSMLHASANNYKKNFNKTEAIWTGMSSLLPGTGQAINGQWWEAGGFFIAWSLAASLTSGIEEQIFINGDESYLVKNDDKETSFSVSLFPGGMFFNISQRW